MDYIKRPKFDLRPEGMGPIIINWIDSKKYPCWRNFSVNIFCNNEDEVNRLGMRMVETIKSQITNQPKSKQE